MHSVSQKFIAFIIGVLVVVGGIFLYNGFIRDKNPDTNQVATTTTSGKRVVTLNQTGVTFELPSGYAAYQREGFEGGYGTTVSIGKETSAGYFKYAGVEIRIMPQAYNQSTGDSYEPNEFIDIVYQTQQQQSGATYTTLFGNKAVSFRYVADNSPAVTGYLKAGQSKRSEEYLVEVTGTTYGSGVEESDELFNAILGSLKVTK